MPPNSVRCPVFVLVGVVPPLYIQRRLPSQQTERANRSPSRRRRGGVVQMRRSLGKVALVLLLGVVIGAVCSEVIGLFLPADSVAEQVFVRSIPFGLETMTINLVVVQLTFGLKFHVNLMSVVGVFLASQMLRWYR
jgi:hypothetical protein